MKKSLSLIVFIFALSSCAAIPTAGPIQIINQDETQADLNDVRVIAKPPTSRMNGVQIASGFIAANISTFGDFNVARKYLTNSVSDSWYPTNFDVLDSASIQYNDLGTGIVEVSGLQIGKLKANHRFEIFPVAKPFLLRLKMQKKSNGLRIASSIRSGILSSSDMVRGFTSYNIYFGNEKFSRLVPEIIWLPKNEKSLATKLTNSLLDGSKEHFKTAVPSGTELRFGSVTVANGTAVVNLNASALMADNAQRKFMLAQVVWTLQGIPGVGRVQVATNDRVLSTQGKTNLNRRDFSNLDPDYASKPSALFMLQNSKLSSRTGGLLVDIGKLKNVDRFEVNAAQTEIAYTANGQLWVSNLDNLKKSEIVRNTVIDFQIDTLGRIWFITANQRLYCQNAEGGIQEVLRLKSASFSSFAISPDGGRIAIVRSSETSSLLEVGSLVSENEILNVVGLRKVEQTFSEVLKVEWLNSRELVAIGKVGISESVTALVSLTNGGLRTLNAPKKFVSLSVSNEGSVVAVTSTKVSWIYQDGLWSRLDSNMQAVFSR